MFKLEVTGVSSSLEVIDVHGVERISEPYEFELEILTTDATLTRYIGQSAIYRMQIGRVTTYRHGILNEISVIDAEDSQVRYKVSLVPAIARLELKADCRIFQDATVEVILSTILQEHGVNDFEFALSGSRVSKDYVVQYRETDLDFFHRIVEEEGLFYFFEHDSDGHTLIIADHASAYKPISGRSQILRYDTNIGASERVTQFSLSHLAVADSVRLRDYSFTAPTANLDISKRASGTAASINEIYDYPGGYMTRSEGQRKLGWRFDAERLNMRTASASSNSLRLAPGFTYRLSGHRYRAANQTYVVAEIIHNGTQDPANIRQVRYQNSAVCVSAKTPLRLTDAYPSLRMHGPQTATVVGPAGEEIYVDEYGRVKVQFHWDRSGQSDENSSAWIRVAQTVAGNGWGSVAIPRIGSEVLIDFVNGDPNQPVVIGSLYNGANPVPYPLPENKNITALKTRSTPNGRGFNELRFDDTAGSEQVLVRSQKDFSLTVHNDSREDTARNSNVSIGRDANLTIAGHRTETVGGNMLLSVGGKLSEEVGGDLTNTVGKGLTQTIGKAYKNTVGDKATINAKSIVLEAADSILFKVGTARVEIKKNGDIKIEGKKIDIKASGTLTMKGSNIS